jgi:hypothetical protein
MFRNSVYFTSLTLSFNILFALLISVQIFAQPKLSGKEMDIKLYSTTFKEGEYIPSKFSCQGADISPALHWEKITKDVKSYALILDDPDAPGGDFVHWVIFNIPGSIRELNENITPSSNIPSEVKLGTNGFGKIGYGGPCPPPGKPHHYHFKLYALDTILHHLEPGATKNQLLNAMEGHIVAKGQLVGLYKR